MDFSFIIHSIFSSEGGSLAILVLFGLVYTEFLKPKLDKLKTYEETLEKLLNSLLTKDDFLLYKSTTDENLNELVLNKISDEVNILHSDFTDLCNKSEEIKVLIKSGFINDIAKIKSIVESMQENLSVHDERAGYIEDSYNEIAKLCNVTYDLLEKLTVEFERAELVKPISRVKLENLSVASNGISQLAQIFEQLGADKRTNSRLSRALKR